MHHVKGIAAEDLAEAGGRTDQDPDAGVQLILCPQPVENGSLIALLASPISFVSHFVLDLIVSFFCLRHAPV